MFDLVLFAGPYIALAVLGTVLFIRHRSVAMGFIASGFAVVAIGRVAVNFLTVSTTVVSSDATSATAVGSLGGVLYWFIDNAEMFGMWIATFGLFGHLLVQGERRAT